MKDYLGAGLLCFGGFFFMSLAVLAENRITPSYETGVIFGVCATTSFFLLLLSGVIYAQSGVKNDR